MSDDQVIRVMIVDDHYTVRKGLGVFLKAKPDLMLVGRPAAGRRR